MRNKEDGARVESKVSTQGSPRPTTRPGWTCIENAIEAAETWCSMCVARWNHNVKTVSDIPHAASVAQRLISENEPAPTKEIHMTKDKTLDNSTVAHAKSQVEDLKIVGNGDTFQLLCKASSHAENWMKSTKAMEIPGVGCVVQVTTQQGDHVAEALVFVPGVVIVDDENHGRKLVDPLDTGV